MATERVSGIKDITQVIVEEGTPAFKSLTAIDQVKDLLGCKLLVTGRIRTRNTTYLIRISDIARK